MSPKQAIIISMSLALILASTFSSAETGCLGFKSVSDVLRHYDIPAGLFPGNVKSFSCKPLNNDEQLLLSIELDSVCKVSRSLLGVGNVVECKKQISAVVSYRLLSNIKGVTVTLNFIGFPFGELMTVTDARIVQAVLTKFLVFDSDKGSSPYFPVAIIPDKPPTCDNKRTTFDKGFYYGRPLLRLVD